MSPALRSPAPPQQPKPPDSTMPFGPGLDAYDEARALANGRGGFRVDPPRMFKARSSERSHELTREERSRDGIERAARIRTAKLDAMAEGRAFKPTKRRRRRNPYGIKGDPFVRDDQGRGSPRRR